MHHLYCYKLAVQFYRQAKGMRLPGHLKNQIERAAASVALNISEGTGKRTRMDQRRFFYIALGSVRELQAIQDLEPNAFSQQAPQNLDSLGATLFSLIRKTPP